MTDIIVTAIPKWVDTFMYFLSSKASPRRNLPILIGANLQSFSVSGNLIKPMQQYILWNTEQLTRVSARNEVKKCIFAFTPREVWDYSIANLEILKRELDPYFEVKIWKEEERKEKYDEEKESVGKSANCGVGELERVVINQMTMCDEVIKRINEKQEEKRINEKQ